MKIHDFKLKKTQQTKIAMLTCYDYPSACIVADSNLDCVLVGDSVAMTVHGHESTIMATMEMMVLHTSAVARGLRNHFLISDLPFLAYRGSTKDIINNVKQLFQAGTHAIKMEGADEILCQTISSLTAAGIPVMGHIGLTPQFIHQLGGYIIQGKEQEQSALLLQQARRLEAAGCFAIVIECVPQHVAKTITEALLIPTIGIGAGAHTDGQVLVWHDLLGLQTQFKPKFIKQYVQSKNALLSAINAYVEDVQHLHFPALEHVF